VPLQSLHPAASQPAIRSRQSYSTQGRVVCIEVSRDGVQGAAFEMLTTHVARQIPVLSKALKAEAQCNYSVNGDLKHEAVSGIRYNENHRRCST
jgi:hypothetical protein